MPWKKGVQTMRRCQREFVKTHHWFMHVSKDWLRCLGSLWQNYFCPSSITADGCCSISADMTGVNSKWDLLTFPHTLSFKHKRSSHPFLVVGTSTDDELKAALVKDVFVYTACKLAGHGLKLFLNSYAVLSSRFLWIWSCSNGSQSGQCLKTIQGST